MLHLQARIHFEEVEIAILVDDELDRARAVVIHSLGQHDRLFAHRFARLGIQERRWRFFNHLLVAALDGAFALVQVDDVAVLVAHHLDFDVARLGDEFLHEQAVVAERGLGFVLRRLDRLNEFAFLVNDAKPFAAAAGRSLHHHRIADLGRDLLGVFGIPDFADIAGNRVHLRGERKFLGLDLVAHRGDGVGVRPDERDPDFRQRLRKGFALGKKTVAGMHRFRARLLAGVQDLVDDEIGLRRRRGADVDGFIGHLDMQRIAIGVRINGDGADTHFAGGLDDPAGDFATVGDEDFLEQKHSPGPSIGA